MDHCPTPFFCPSPPPFQGILVDEMPLSLSQESLLSLPLMMATSWTLCIQDVANIYPQLPWRPHLGLQSLSGGMHTVNSASPLKNDEYHPTLYPEVTYFISPMKTWLYFSFQSSSYIGEYSGFH